MSTSKRIAIFSDEMYRRDAAMGRGAGHNGEGRPLGGGRGLDVHVRLTVPLCVLSRVRVRVFAGRSGDRRVK